MIHQRIINNVHQETQNVFLLLILFTIDTQWSSLYAQTDVACKSKSFSLNEGASSNMQFWSQWHETNKKQHRKSTQLTPSTCKLRAVCKTKWSGRGDLSAILSPGSILNLHANATY